MRYQDALLLQKQQAEKEERQREAQRQLEKVAAKVEERYNYWLQCRDPFAESRRRIEALLSPTRNVAISATGSTAVRSTPTLQQQQQQFPPPRSRSPSSSGHSIPLLLEQNNAATGTREPSVRHAAAASDLDPTAFSLYRKLRQPQQ